MCGRLCPQESLCEGDCVVGKKAIPVAIGRLEAFIADYQRDNGGVRYPRSRPRPASASLSSAPARPGSPSPRYCAVRGHAVRVFEAWPTPGGVLRYGIPDFKMDKRHVDDQVDYLERLGVEFQLQHAHRIRHDD